MSDGSYVVSQNLVSRKSCSLVMLYKRRRAPVVARFSS
jgi:hypothetical protein